MFAPDDAQPGPLLPDLLTSGLDVVFVGAAPSVLAAAVGHYYAGPTNKFWLLLYQAGFTPRQLRAEEDHEVLAYGAGLTCVFKHICSSANHLLPPPTEIQRARLREKILANAPRCVCFNGKDVYGMATGRVCTDWGQQEESIGSARIFVVHSSSARADGWGRERLALYHELKALVDASRENR